MTDELLDQIRRRNRHERTFLAGVEAGMDLMHVSGSLSREEFGQALSDAFDEWYEDEHQ